VLSQAPESGRIDTDTRLRFPHLRSLLPSRRGAAREKFLTRSHYVKNVTSVTGPCRVCTNSVEALHSRSAPSYGGLAMTSTVVIPAEVVDLLRDGLRSQIATVAQWITHANELEGGCDHPERYQDPLECLDALRALLEEIGWSTPPSDPQVDLETHAWALLEALQDQISVHADMLRDCKLNDERRGILTREMNPLSTLALTVLLRTQAHILRPTAPHE
jgi:hypothetical protein